MKCFIYGVIGVLFSLGVFFVGRTQYSDYVVMVQTDRWIGELQPLMSEVKAKAIKIHSLNGVASDIHKPEPDKNTTIFDVLDSGTIVVKGGRDGQLLILVPSLVDDKFTWRCLVGGDNALSRKCKEYGWDNDGKQG